MSEHTDGPWRAMPVEQWEAIKGDQPSSICHVGEFVIVTQNPSYEFHGTCEADANLIAAAPEMLELLRFLNDRGGLGYDIHDRLRAAIAKATGGE